MPDECADIQTIARSFKKREIAFQKRFSRAKYNFRDTNNVLKFRLMALFMPINRQREIKATDEFNIYF